MLSYATKSIFIIKVTENSKNRNWQRYTTEKSETFSLKYGKSWRKLETIL